MAPLKVKPFILKKIITLFFILGIIGIGLYYVTFQARFLLMGPQVILSEELPTVQTERTVILRGKTSNITALYLNGRAIVTNEAGEFAEKVVLEDGYSIFSIDAVDLYGRTIHLERPFVYQGESLTNNININYGQENS
jgi:hypothetical protein